MDDFNGHTNEHAPEPDERPDDEAPWAAENPDPAAESGDLGEEIFPPPGVGDEDEPAPPRKSGRGPRVVACVVVILAVLGLLATVMSVKLYLEHGAAMRTLEESVQSMALLSVKLGASEKIQGRLGWLSKAIERRDWQQAQRAAEALRAEEVEPHAGATPMEDLLGGGEATGELPDPMKVEDLPVEARAFFARTPKAWRAFLGFTQAGIRMRDAGLDVDDLRELREEMLEAARLGQEERLSELLTLARQIIERRTGPEAGRAFEEKMQAFGRAFGQAQQQRRDVAPAAKLAGEAERAARNGEMGRATELIEQATVALKEARRLPGGGRPMRISMPQGMGFGPSLPELGFLQFLAGTLNNVMQMERADLAHVWSQVEIAAGAIREHNQDQIREILGEAMDVMDLINVRRTEMSQHIQVTQEQMMQPPPQGEQPPRPQGPSPEELMRELQTTINTVLGDAHKMTDEEFEQNKEGMIAALLSVLMPDAPPPRTADPNMTPEERARAKMQWVAAPYTELKRREVDTTELDAILSQAREALAAHDYEAAEELVDSSVPMIDKLLAESAPPPDEEEDPEADANPPADDATDAGTIEPEVEDPTP